MLEELKGILEIVLPEVDLTGITEKTRLVEDLGCDSLAMMMLSMEIEDRYGFKFEQFVQFETVGEACQYVQDKI